LTNLAPSIAHVWEKLVPGTLTLAGIYAIVHGLTAEKFTFRSLGWLPGQERQKFSPRWYERMLMVLLGLALAITSLWSLLGLHWLR
jgi:hypothetical protein